MSHIWPDSFAGWSVSPKGAPLEGANAGFQRSRNGACRGRKEKKSSKLVNNARGRSHFFFRPSIGDGPCASRPAREDRPVRVWVQGPRRCARTREVDALVRRPASSPLLHPSILHHTHAGRVRRRECMAGPCYGEPWVAGDPCARVLGGEDGPLAARPQAPLEVVEKFLTRQRPTPHLL